MDLKSENKVITITNFYYPYVGGITSYVETLKKGLVNSNYKNEIICYPFFFRKIENSIRSRAVWIIFRYIFILLFIISAEIIIIKNRFAHKKLIVHTHSANFCLVVGVLSKFIGCRTLHTFHSPIDRNFKHLEKFLTRTDAVVFVSDEHKKLYEKYFYITNENIEIIPGLVDQEKYRPRDTRERNKIKNDLIDKLGKDHINDKIVLFIGRIVEEKGAEVLVRSVGEVKNSVNNIYVVLVGPHSRTWKEKDFFNKLNLYVDKNKLDNNILFLGEGTEELIKKLYTISSFVVVPSIWEASGIVPFEAMASGKPVIVTKVGGLKSKIVDGKTGLLAESGNPSDLARKMIRLLKDEDLLNEMGINARKYVEKNHPISKMIKPYLEIYTRIQNEVK